MKYTDAVEYMESLKEYSSVPDVDTLKRLCEKLDNPQNKLKFIHIEGSTVKGEVNAYVSAILRCAGYKVGKFPALTLNEYQERFQIGNKPITKKAFGELTEQVKTACESMFAEGELHPSLPEVELAISFLYFKQQDCDVVLLEQDFMENPLQVLHIPEVSIDTTALKKIKYGLTNQKFDYKAWKGLEISLAGVDMIEKAAIALEICSCLLEQGYEISEGALRKGLKEAVYPGCFNLLGKKPYFVIDDADDEVSATWLIRSMEQYFPNKRKIFIIGMSAESEYEKVISMTHAYGDWIITVTPPNHKGAMSSYELAAEVTKVHEKVTAVDSLEEAVEVAHLLAGREDVIIAFGCQAILGKLIKIMDK